MAFAQPQLAISLHTPSTVQPLTQPHTVHKWLTTPDMQMPALQWITVNMHLTISHGACTATASDILIHPRHRPIACTATGKHESITPARYILVTTLYITTCLFTCIHLPHCQHSHHQWHAPVPTLPAQPPVTTAATHMYWQLCFSSYYPSIHIQQYWYGRESRCNCWLSPSRVLLLSSIQCDGIFILVLFFYITVISCLYHDYLFCYFTR